VDVLAEDNVSTTLEHWQLLREQINAF
jgi:hypothetical protein